MSLVSALVLSQQGSGAAGLSTALIAGLFTLLGAAITLGFQVVSGHNVNRRDDRKQAIDAVADLAASAWLIVQVPSRQPSPSSSVSTEDERSKTHTEVLSTFYAAYARLILVAPAARGATGSFRDYVTNKTVSAAGDPRAEIDGFIEAVRPKLRSPVFAFLRPR